MGERLTDLQDVVDSEGGEELVEGLLPHVCGEEGEDGGQVGDQPEQSQATEEHALAPELKLLPNLGKQIGFLSQRV